MLNRLIVSVSVALICGCTSITGAKGPPTSLHSQQVTYATQAVLGKCPSGSQQDADLRAAGVSDALGASIIAQGVNRIGAAIKAAAGPETRQILIRRNVELSAREPFGPCLIVARGWYHKEDTDKPAYQSTDGSGFKYDKTMAALFHEIGLPLATTPDFFFEGILKKSTDETASTLAPIYAFLATPIASNFLRPSKARRVLVSFAVTSPGKAANLVKGQGSTVVLGNLQPPKGKSFPTDSPYLETKIECRKNCGGSFAQRMRSIYESEWFSIKLSKEPSPMTLQVLVSETRGASAFLKFVSDVFGDAQKDLVTELQETFVSSRGELADETKQAAEETAANNYDNAYAAAIGALSACVDAPTDAAKIAAAKVAIRNFNKAARASNKNDGIYFTEEEIDSLKLNEDMSGPCQTLLSKL